jgi:hypothetical protein
MGGGLMQLVAYGAQDVYLTGNPQITFFKVVYRRHTNFSMEAIEQTINGSQQTGTGSVTISRNGDLVHKVYVVAKNAPVAMTNGSEMVSLAELEIGGQLIDRHRSEWMQIWNELSTPESKSIGLKALQRDIGSDVTGAKTVMVPLQFWFCRNPGLALPLIALQYHEVKIKCTWGSGPAKGDTCPKSVFCDYIYLDTDERRRFAQVSHEYLIEQVQYASIGTADTTVKLNFNHPVKELIWTSTTDYGNAKLVLNGHDRFSAQDKEYFQLRQQIDYHTAVPKQNLPSAAQTSLLDRQITLAKPAGGADNYEIENNADAVAANGSDFDLTSNVITLSAGDAIAKTVFPQGTQLAIVVTATADDGADITATPAEAVGDMYFCTVTADATGDQNVLTIPVSTLTTAHATPKVMSGTADTDSNSSVAVFIVTNGNSAQARTSKMTKKINCYSFALKPEEHQPSGTCNFSRIDTAQLILKTALGVGHWVYAVNYNVLRIMSGMGGLAYSN